MRKSLVIRIDKNSIYYFLMLIPFIPLKFVEYEIPIWSRVYSYARIIVIVILLFRLFVIRRRFMMPLGLALLFFVPGLFSTFLAGESYYTLFYYGVYLFGLTLLIEDGVYFDAKAFLNGCLLLFEILIYINLLFYIIRPDGYMTNHYFFGNYNATLRYLFPGIILGAIHAFQLKGRITVRFCCMFIALLYFLIRAGSMTSMFGMLLFIIAILCFMIFKRSLFFKFEYFMLISIIITIMVAVFGRFQMFERIITVFLGKDMTLSNRTTIWARTIQEIIKKPIWGYGQLSYNSTANILNGSLDPHNIFLGTLLYGGIVGIIILVIILLVVLRQLRIGRKECPQIAMIFDAGFCTYFLMWNFETYSNIDEFYKIFVFFVMAYYCINFAQGVKRKDSG